MQMNNRSVRRVASAAAVAVMALAGSAFATPTFLGGNYTITHRGNFGGNADVRTFSSENIPAYSSSVYQYSAPTGNPITNGTATSTARAGIGYVIGSNYLGLSFPGGTNITQRGNSNSAPSTASSMQIDFSATFQINDTPFTNTTAGAFFGLLGNLPTGGTAFAELIVDATFTYTRPENDPQSLRSPITPTPFFFRSAPGSFTFSRTDVTSTNPTTLAVGSTVRIDGFIRFRVHNDLDEASIETDGEGGTSVPAPSGALALGLAGMLAARRRR